MKLLSIIKFIWGHPLNRDRKLLGLVRFLQGQVGSRILKTSIVWPFANDARLIISRGMKGATGNIYVGLMELEEMGFILHYLRPSDSFLDIGANIGAYTILASKVVGARCIAVEPDEINFSALMDNIYFNRVYDRVMAINVAAGSKKGKIKFRSGMGPISHIQEHIEAKSSNDCGDVESLPLDYIAKGLKADVLKSDTEGYETEVIAGGEKILADPNLNVVLIELRGHGKRYGFDEQIIDRKMRTLGFNSYIYNPLCRSLICKPESNSSLGYMLYIRNFEKALERIALAPQYKIKDQNI